jgi:hypothetical protein
MSSAVAVQTKRLGSLHEVSRIGGIHPVADPMPGVADVVAIGPYRTPLCTFSFKTFCAGAASRSSSDHTRAAARSRGL